MVVDPGKPERGVFTARFVIPTECACAVARFEDGYTMRPPSTTFGPGGGSGRGRGRDRGGGGGGGAAAGGFDDDDDELIGGCASSLSTSPTATQPVLVPLDPRKQLRHWWQLVMGVKIWVALVGCSIGFFFSLLLLGQPIT